MTSFAARVDTAEEADLAFSCGADAVLTGGRMRLETGFEATLTPAELVTGGYDQTRPVVAVFVGRIPDAADLREVASSGCRGVLLRWPVAVVADVGLPALARVLDLCRDAGLSCGIEGVLEPPDVPRLLPLRPDWLVVGRALRFDGRLQPEHVRLFRALIPTVAVFVDEPPAAAAVALRPTRPDRRVVRDLVVAMAIGAYDQELGRTQRVGFSVEAEVRPLGRPVRDMADVVSYDLIADAIRSVAAAGHVAFVETVAETVAERVMEHPRVLTVRVRVEKLDLGPGAMGVEVWRERVPDP